MTIYANMVHKVLFTDKVICVSQALKLSLRHYVDTQESKLRCPLARAPLNMFKKNIVSFTLDAKKLEFSTKFKAPV